jgi:hypothetical protein
MSNKFNEVINHILLFMIDNYNNQNHIYLRMIIQIILTLQVTIVNFQHLEVVVNINQIHTIHLIILQQE